MRDTYRHLKKFGLVTPRAIQQHLNSFSEVRLEKFLDSYVELTKQRPLAITAAPRATDIYPDSYGTDIPIGLIRQLGIYAHRIYVHDPLLRAALEYPNLHTIRYIVEHPSKEERVAYFKSSLAKQIETLIYIQPLVEANIVHLAPTEFMYPPRNANNIYADDFVGPDGTIGETRLDNLTRLPSGFEEYCDRQITVVPARYVNNESIVTDEELTPRRMIAVGFEGEPEVYPFRLSDVTPGEEDEGARRVTMFFDPKDPFNPPVDEQIFWSWVNGTKRKLVIERLDRLAQDLILASMAKAKFITHLPASNQLAQMAMNATANSREEKRINGLLQMDLPFFDQIDPKSIAKARQNEAGFEEFRAALDKAFDGIKEEVNSPGFQQQLESITRDLLTLPLKRIDRDMKALQRNLAISGVIGVGSLVTTILNPVASTFIGAATANLVAYRQNRQQEDSIRQLPSYYYWKIVKK